jgi:hypothetical protein
MRAYVQTYMRALTCMYEHAYLLLVGAHTHVYIYTRVRDKTYTVRMEYGCQRASAESE